MCGGQGERAGQGQAERWGASADVSWLLAENVRAARSACAPAPLRPCPSHLPPSALQPPAAPPQVIVFNKGGIEQRGTPEVRPAAYAVPAVCSLGVQQGVVGACGLWQPQPASSGSGGGTHPPSRSLPPSLPPALQEVARDPASPFVMNFVGDVNHLPATSQARAALCDALRRSVAGPCGGARIGPVPAGAVPGEAAATSS